MSSAGRFVLLVTGLGAGAAVASAISDTRSPVATHVMMPMVRLALDAETAHRWAVWLAASPFSPRDPKPDPPSLHTTVFGKNFRNPVGLAAGFDKHAEAMDGLLAMGFGFVEVGSITPQPQPGNPKPRVFRLEADRAVINRYGFNSDGWTEAYGRLKAWRDKHNSEGLPPKGPVGINLGKNKDQTDAVADYTTGAANLGALADYLVINVSSPNTPGLRSLQGRKQLAELVSSVRTARNLLPNRPPLLIKIAPDLVEEDMADIAVVALEQMVDGLIISNTTVTRPATLKSATELVKETGGLSGPPLMEQSTRVLARMYQLTHGQIPLIGVGGISSGQDAYEKILNGASLVQLYTAMSYEGPGVVARIKDELSELLRRDGYTRVADAVGKKLSLP